MIYEKTIALNNNKFTLLRDLLWSTTDLAHESDTLLEYSPCVSLGPFIRGIRKGLVRV